MKTIISLCLVCSLALAAGHPPPPIAHPIQSQDDLHLYMEPNENSMELQEDPEFDLSSSEAHPIEVYPWEDRSVYEYDENDDDSYDNDFIRNKRQTARDLAMDLALSHQDKHGNNRPVGKLHGGVTLNADIHDRNNYHAFGGAGVGSVLWRSRNNRHSVGAGAYVGQSMGRFGGHRYTSRPDFGAGFGYRFRF